MYKIIDIFKGTQKIVKSVMKRQREYRIQFDKEKDKKDFIQTTIDKTENVIEVATENEASPTAEHSYFFTHYKDRKLYLKYTNGNEASVIVVRVVGDEEIVCDNRYSIDHITWLDYYDGAKEITEEEFESVCKRQTDIEEYVSRKVSSNDTFYISMTAEDGMEIFEFEGRKYKRSVGTVIDEGIVEGKYEDVDLDFVVSWAKRRGGACNILSKSNFDEWWKKIK